jgi:phosphatidylserine/phosphatidylglycerophosphate/cardiolipin synthase-like enzyme
MVDSIPVELYFSPSDQSTDKINTAILTADASVYFCILAYTRQDVCDTMKTRWDSGISVKGVFDRADWLGEYSKSRDMTGDPSSFNPWSPPAPVYSDSVTAPWGPKMLHHKYMLIDGDHDSTAIVITGSQNWSNNGEQRNDENILIIQSADIANQYLQEFAERYREAGGEYLALAEKRDCRPNTEDIRLSTQPNPFATVTRLEAIGTSENTKTNLTIYDASGRLVKSVELETNNYQLGAGLKAGVYFLRLKAEEYSTIKKIIKIR